MNTYTLRAYEHIRYLTETIGGRGSCGPGERKAAGYVHEQLCDLGVREARVETFRGSPTTYRPYLYAFAAGLLGTILALLFGSRLALAAGALFNLLGAWAMIAETEFAGHWARWISPKATSQNVVGRISPTGTVKHKAVLCAHLDTHRTPVFYSSKTWQNIFSLMISLAFLSLVAGSLMFGIGVVLGWLTSRWLAVLLLPFQAFVLALVLHADFTPFSPGANDDASGVGVILGVVERLLKEPLDSMEVHLVFTGCEETASYGIIAYLNKHAEDLGKDAVYIILDEVGLGHVKYITNDGLIIKHPTHPKALSLARLAAANVEREVMELPGTAYCDALPATMRGLAAVTVSSSLPSHSVTSVHWHQMSDRVEFLDPQPLEDAHIFTWNLLQEIEKS